MKIFVKTKSYLEYIKDLTEWKPEDDDDLKHCSRKNIPYFENLNKKF